MSKPTAILQKRFLQEHFSLAWFEAIQAYKGIVDGLVDFEQKEQFVLALANAIEIGSKQILIDENNISVFQKKWLKEDSRGVTVATALSTNEFLHSYNDFLFSHEPGAVYKTVELKEAVKLLRDDILKEQGNNAELLWKDIQNGMSFLIDSRNNAIHFHISETSFLASFHDFISLQKLFLFFEQFFKSKNLIPTNGWGRKSRENIDNLFEIPKNAVDVSSYEDLVHRSASMRLILDKVGLHDNGFSIDKVFSESDYSIAYYIFNQCTDDAVDTNEGFVIFYRRIRILIDFGLIKKVLIHNEAMQDIVDDEIIDQGPSDDLVLFVAK